MTAAGSNHEEALRDHLGEMAQQWPSFAWVVEKLRRAGLPPTHARPRPREEQRHSWYLFVKPDEALRGHLDLAPEFLVLCAPWNEMHADDIAAAEKLVQENPRLDPGFVLVLTEDAQAYDRLKQRLPQARSYFFMTTQALKSEADPQEFVREFLRARLGARHLFALQQPASGPQFFGREREFEALERHVMNGVCVGLFGLRKIGKTSLLLKLAEKYRDAAPGQRRLLPIHLDLQTISFDRRNLGGLVDSLDRALREVEQRAGLPTAKRVAAANPGTMAERMMSLLSAGKANQVPRLLLVIDEYERLLDRRLPVKDGIEFLSWLRGLAQTSQGRFVFVLAGRNQRFLSSARIEGYDHPLYRFLHDMPISGLAPDDCRKMVRKIGRRLLLRFSPEALNVIEQESGGHPMLARLLGDLVDQQVTGQRPREIPVELVAGTLPRFRRVADEDMRELLDAAIDIDPQAQDRLIHLGHGAQWVGGALQDRIDDALVRYGILDAQRAHLRIGALQPWLRENFALPRLSAHG